MTLASRPAQRDPFDAFVYVVESPSADDLYDGRTEGRVLTEAFQLAGIKNRYIVAAGRDQFQRALGHDFATAVRQVGAVPILHLSAHGCDEGIGLTDGDLVTWDQLRDLLMPANRALGDLLLVCMSACYGTAGRRMAMRVGEPLPYFAILGHPDSPTWADAAIGYAAFYHRLFDGSGLMTALVAMRAASGDDRFDIHVGEQDQGLWTDLIRRLTAQSVADDLASDSDQRSAGAV
jgi:hypothetical protein